jgi:hypothetical protein
MPHIEPFHRKQILTNLFFCAYNIPMQSNKASKKTRKIVDETVTASPEIGAEATGAPRNTKSSKSKKAEPADMGLANHQHKTGSISLAEPGRTENAQTGKVMAAAADTAKAPSGTPHSPSAAAHVVSHEEIARLAHSYWAARGYAHGSAEADWLRAEQELRAHR